MHVSMITKSSISLIIFKAIQILHRAYMHIHVHILHRPLHTHVHVHVYTCTLSVKDASSHTTYCVMPKLHEHVIAFPHRMKNKTKRL